MSSRVRIAVVGSGMIQYAVSLGALPRKGKGSIGVTNPKESIMRAIRPFTMTAVSEWCRVRTLGGKAMGGLLIGAGTLVATLTIADVVHATDVNSPMQTVKITISELLHILKGERDTSRPNQRRSDVEQLIRRHVSYDEMAKRCLGKPWMGLDDGQREEFVGLFVQMLRDGLANRMLEYPDDEQILYLWEQEDLGFANVAIKLSGRKVDTSVEFRLSNHAEQWLLYDAIIDGASIVSNYHAQFSAVIREVSYVGLIGKMKQRTLLVKLFEGQ